MKFMLKKLEIQHLKVIQPQKSNGEKHKISENSCYFIKRLKRKLGSSCPETKKLFFEHPGDPKNVNVYIEPWQFLTLSVFPNPFSYFPYFDGFVFLVGSSLVRNKIFHGPELDQ